MAELTTSTSWDAGDGPKVLVEADNWSARHHMAHALEEAGYRVAACPGPSGADTRCPLAAGATCPTVDEVDVIVFALHPGDPRNRECLRAHRSLHPDRPVVLDLPEAVMARHPGDFAGCVLVQEPGSAESLATAVAHATT